MSHYTKPSLEGSTARHSQSPSLADITAQERAQQSSRNKHPDELDTAALGVYIPDAKPERLGTASDDLERQTQLPIHESAEAGAEEEEYEQGYGTDNETRHSYEYTRGRHEPRPDPLSRHSSALSIVRSRNSAARSRRQSGGSGDNQDNALEKKTTTTREGFGHALMHEKTGRDYLVDFDGKDDPYRPINWSFRKKAVTTILYGLTTAGITFASSVYSAAISEISDEFHVGTEVSNLGISFILFGFGLGPLIWAPLSEVYGRKAAVLTPYFISAMFAFATGASKDIQSVLITRFFAGFFGSAPITNTGGVLGDIWNAQERGMAMVAYALAVTGGPTLGPVVGAAIVTSPYLSWRWTMYITGIIQLVVLFFDIILLDESFNPILLTYKARRLRHESGNWALHAEHEEWDVSIRALSQKYLVRPFQLLFTPICFMVALYASFVYSILYANLSAFPIEFQQVRGWSPVVASLPFLALLVGILIAGGLNVLNNKYYFRKFKQNGNKPVPEARLPPMMIGSVVFAMGLFLFAWTSSPSVHWIAPVIGCVLIGIGFFTIFQASLNYLVDTFTKFGASAIAANTFLRSGLAGAFPLFIDQCLHAIGVDWGMTIFACFAVLLIPVPYIFFIFGRRIRARGKWSRPSTL